eukprot:3579154-Rhodomonas_salina.2
MEAVGLMGSCSGCSVPHDAEAFTGVTESAVLVQPSVAVVLKVCDTGGLSQSVKASATTMPKGQVPMMRVRMQQTPVFSDVGVLEVSGNHAQAQGGITLKLIVANNTERSTT